MPPDRAHSDGRHVTVNIRFGPEDVDCTLGVILNEHGDDVGRGPSSDRFLEAFASANSLIPDLNGNEALLGSLPKLETSRVVRHARYGIEPPQAPRGREASDTSRDTPTP